jgi:hypothetical protein
MEIKNEIKIKFSSIFENICRWLYVSLFLNNLPTLIKFTLSSDYY